MVQANPTNSKRRATGGGRWRRIINLAVASRRSRIGDVFLAAILAFVSGAANLGGLFAIGHFATHMTGYLSWLADGVVVGDPQLLGYSLLALSLFFIGGIVSTLCLHTLAQKQPDIRVAVPLALQGICLTTFALIVLLPPTLQVSLGLALLCFTMGLQNAMIAKISRFTIRTTHMTGLVTDLSIEAGRWASARVLGQPSLRPQRMRSVVLSLLIGLFFLGGLAGSLAYRLLGFAFTVPFAMVILGLSCQCFWRVYQRRKRRAGGGSL